MSDLIPIERIESKILLIRGRKVLLDRDLAELYRVPTSQLKRSVKRNITRFPEGVSLLSPKWSLKIGYANFAYPMIKLD